VGKEALCYTVTGEPGVCGDGACDADGRPLSTELAHHVGQCTPNTFIGTEYIACHTLTPTTIIII
jgi:hypothetical protein